MIFRLFTEIMCNKKISDMCLGP